MDQQEIFRKQFQSDLAYLSKDLKSVEKKADHTFKEKEHQTLEQEYMSAMSQGFQRMLLFGIKTSEFGKVPGTVRNMQYLYEDQKEIQKNRQIVESRKKKQSSQEKDAQARMNTGVSQEIVRKAKAVASGCLPLYEQKKQQQVQVSVGKKDFTGTEFYVKRAYDFVSEQEMQQQVVDLMLKRDALAVRIKNANPQNDTQKAEHEYDKQLLKSLVDALHTWMLVGGISEKGGQVSQKDKEKAAAHLPLAIENYEYQVKNRDALIGGVIFEKFKKTKQYKDSYKECKNHDLNSTKQTLGINQPIANVYKDDIASLRSMISENGPYDARKEDLIKKIYAEYMQHGIAYAKRNLEYKAAANALANQRKESAYLSAWWLQEDSLSRQHELAMDANAAYLKYLIKGEMPDPTLAVYIEQHWHTNAFAEHLDQKAGDLYTNRQDRVNRIKARIEELQHADIKGMNEERRKTAIDKLENSLHNDMSIQAADQAATTDQELELKYFSLDKCQVTAYDPVGPGHRDVIRLMMPLNGRVTDIDPQEAKANKCAMVQFCNGRYLGNQKDVNGRMIIAKRDDLSCTREEALGSLPRLVSMLDQAKTDLKQYFDDHSEAFAVESLEQAYQNLDIVTHVYKKSQGMGDVCDKICHSKYFFLLDVNMQKHMKELWDFGRAMTFLSFGRIKVIGYTQDLTLREATSDNVNNFCDCLDQTFEDYLEKYGKVNQYTIDRLREEYNGGTGL